MPQNPSTYTLNTKIFKLALEIQQILGELKSVQLVKPSLKLRKENKIKTIHHTLAIEGNSLNLTQITAILEKKRVIGPKNQITEVINALNIYENLSDINPLKESEIKNTHRILMNDLVDNPGNYRSKNVGILKGTHVGHVAPQPKFVDTLMQNLFKYLNDKTEESFLIKACVFHYELEFIHPFEDGNGHMGRLWQQLLLMKHSEIFMYVSVESLIHKNQKKYYSVLENCDKSGESTSFIEFSLGIIIQALHEFKNAHKPNKITAKERIDFALSKLPKSGFSRKEYLLLFPEISTATASRDLASAVERKRVGLIGHKSQARYRII